jgi:hypothetical protein
MNWSGGGQQNVGIVRLMGGQFAGDGCLLCSEYAIQSTEE